MACGVTMCTMPMHDLPPSTTSTAANPASLAWSWQPGFAQLGAAFVTPLSPTPLPGLRWVARSDDAAQAAGLPANWAEHPDALSLLGGNTLPDGSQPYASVYSGHQFGVWAGQLGDGRAITLGETAAGLELQLKGAGRTPYSRGGDGRAVLRSSIREFLCSEAMHGLGIPTTRALSLVASPAPIYREEVETAAVVCRTAPSFVRSGHFEHFAARDKIDALRQLADYVIDRYYPACRQPSPTNANANANAYAHLLRAVSLRTAHMLAHWQAVGFCHGVMNTDNMSILGLTLDYGPFQFMDVFNPQHICNHSDHQGRYAFGKQPQIAYWNLFCLGQALLPLIGDEDDTVSAIEIYRRAFGQSFRQKMRAKLGLDATRATLDDDDDPATPVIGHLLHNLAEQQVDHTIFWRRLSHAAASGDFGPVQALFLQTVAWQEWLHSYQELQAQEGTPADAALMLRTNPALVLRNHLGELAITASREGDDRMVQDLLQALRNPFSDQGLPAAWTDFPPSWASSISISCSS